MEKNRLKSWFRKSDSLVAAFVVPVIILIIIFIQREIFPFGQNSFLCTDMYHQYAPFFSEFQFKLQNGHSLLYSWNAGLGINFSALYAYYLASPLNWLAVLVPKAYIIEFMTYMVVFKTGLAGLAMSYYLNKHSENSVFTSAFFGIFYALSGYLVAYSWNIMWVDCIILFPLILLGLENIVTKKKGLLYVIALGLCIMSNYYISIMICIFLCIYLVMMLIVNRQKSFGDCMASVGLFAGYSLLAGAFAAVVFLPALFALKSTASGDITFPQVVTQYFSIIDMLARHMVNVQTEQVLDHWPNIYCGVAVYITTLLYLMNRKIALKEKIVYVCAAVLLLASFSLNILNFIWHGFHYPNSLPARQSFIYIFLVLFMGFRAADNLEGNTVKDIGIATLVSLAFILLCQKVVTDDAFTWSVFYISMIFVALYGLLLYLYRAGKLSVNVLTFILIAVVAIESAINTTATGITIVRRDLYVQEDTAVASCMDAIAEDTDFYRVEKVTRKTKDDGAWYNIPTVSLFSSTAKAALSDWYKKLGCESSANAYSITGSTPLVDALLDVKYAIYTGTSDDATKTLIAGLEDTNLYQNQYCLPLGYMLPTDITDQWDLEFEDPALQQNQFCDVIGAAQVMRPVNGYHSGRKYSTTIEEEGLYYAYSENSATEKVKVIINGTEKSFENVNRGYFMDLGILHESDIVDIEADDESATAISIYRFDYDALGEVVERLGERGLLAVTSFDDTHVNGSVDVAADGMLMLSVPYEAGWKITVDGAEAKAIALWNAFTGIELTEGHHDIAMRYQPEGLGYGVIVTGIALGILFLIVMIKLILYLVRKSKTKKENGELQDRTEADEPQKRTETPEQMIRTEPAEPMSRMETVASQAGAEATEAKAQKSGLSGKAEERFTPAEPPAKEPVTTAIESPFIAKESPFIAKESPQGKETTQGNETLPENRPDHYRESSGNRGNHLSVSPSVRLGDISQIDLSAGKRKDGAAAESAGKPETGSDQ